MSHFATTVLFRKRTAEKRNEKHHEKTSKIHAKSDGKSCRFRKSMADVIVHAFCSILGQFLVKNVLWDLPGRPWEAQGPSRGRPRGPWGGSRGALGSLGEGPGPLWEPSGDDKIAPGPLWGGLGTPRDPPGWIFHGFLMESEQTTVRLAKGKLQGCHCHREPATTQRCWWHWPRAPRNWQRYLLQLKTCGDATATGKLPRREF